MKIPEEAQAEAREIHLRLSRPVTITGERDELFLQKNGRLDKMPGSNARISSRDELQESFQSLCGYSVHSCQQELRGGFLTVQGGHRAGICGTAVTEQGRLTGLREPGSINLRIARQVYGAADQLVRRVFSNGLCSLLIAGVPASGKTTLLRDMIRQISSGKIGQVQKVSVVDERGELAACYRGEPQNDLGPCCDVLDGYPKGEGMNLALRTLSPQLLVCDEIGTAEDAAAIENSVHAGVPIAASVHGRTLAELLLRPQIARLLGAGVFQKIIFLEGAEHPCRIHEIVDWNQTAASIPTEEKPVSE